MTVGRVTSAVAGSLEWLLHPVSFDSFLRDYWETRPLLVSREVPEHYAGLPDLDSVDELITATAGSPMYSMDEGRLVRAGHTGGVSQRAFRRGIGGMPDIQDIYRAYHGGYTVVLNRIHRRSAAVAALCRALEAKLHHRVGANLYLTPGHAQGLRPHVDTHDVFILQLHGSKEWHVASASQDLPLALAKHDALTSFSGHRVHTLRPGDLLYLPRGFPHEAVTSTSSSLHLTVGIHVYRWVDLFVEMLGLLAEERLAFRHALPPSFLDTPLDPLRLSGILEEMTAALGDSSVAEHAKIRLGSRLLREAKTADSGHFRSIDKIQSLAGDSIVEHASGMMCRVRCDNGSALIEFAGNYVSGPVVIEPALRFIAERKRFAVKELPGELSVHDKVGLVSRLASEGLLCIPYDQTTEADSNEH